VTTLPESPYKGLSAFEDSELDALLFFGRERECEVVVANLIASRLTILYGPSGVGKSSLLAASVARKLRELPEQPLVVVFSRWSEDPAAALAEAVADAAGLGRELGAVEALEQVQAGRDVYLVLDQAEEYFLYHGDEGGPGTFADVLPAIVTAPLRVNVLVSLREDSLAKLDRFTGQIAGLFANTLRLDRLDRDAARAAITGPVERFAELSGELVEIEPELVERVLDQVGSGRIASSLGGRGAVAEDDRSARMEAPYLQLVMQRLWDEERADGSSALRADTLVRLGGAQTIVQEHLESALAELSPDEQDVASRIFDHLVTPSGAKIAHDALDLAGFAGVPPAELEPVLEALTTRRILRSVEEGRGRRFEIFHDVLAEPVLSWRARHEAERRLEQQTEAADRRHRRLLAVLAVAAVLLAVMSAVTVYALVERGNARSEARRAQAHQLEALSAAGIPLDPERSLILALDAARLEPSNSAAAALRNALLESRIRVVVHAGEPLLAAWMGAGRIRAVGASGELYVADAANGSILRRTSSGMRVLQASFADDGTAVVTGRDGRVRLLGPSGAVRVVPHLDGVDAAVSSADASRVLALTEGVRARLVDTATGKVIQTFRHPGAVSGAVSPASARVAVGSADQSVTVWAVGRRAPVRMLPDNTGHPLALAFSPDGAFVAAASSDALARIWRFGVGGVLGTVPGGVTAVTALGFSTDGEHIVTGSKDGSVRVSKADTGAPLVVLMGHDDLITSAAFTGPAGSPVVTASLDGTARVWDAMFQPELRLIARLPAEITRIGFDNAGRILATTSRGQVATVDPLSGAVVAAEAAPPATRLVRGPRGATALIKANTVVLRHDGKTIVLRGHRGRVNAVAFSPDGSMLATASRDRDVRLWSVASGTLLRSLQHNSDVRAVAFSRDGRWLVTAASRAAIWDPHTGALVVRVQGHEGLLSAAAFDPSGRYLITGGADATLRRYRCEVCGGLGELVNLAEQRLAVTGRTLTAEEREQAKG
jgi:WD40 repeat protein